jgi:hypothetical protein
VFENEILYDILVSPVCGVSSNWSNQPGVTKKAHHKAAHCLLLVAETNRRSGYEQTPETPEDMNVPYERERLFL